MDLTITDALNLFISLLLLNFIVAIIIVLNRFHIINSKKFAEKVFRFIYSDFRNLSITKQDIKKNKYLRNIKVFEDEYVNSCQSIKNDLIEKKAIDFLKLSGSIKKQIKNLNSFVKYKKIRATVFLGTINLPEVVRALENQLIKENNFIYKMYISDALSNLNSISSIPVIVSTLYDAPAWYRKKVHTFITNFDKKFIPFVKEYFTKKDLEIIELIIAFSSSFEDEILKNYLLEKSLSDDIETAVLASKALRKKYFYYLNAPEYLYHKDLRIRNIAVEALETIPTRKSIVELIPFLKFKETKSQAITSISTIVKKKQNLIDFVAVQFHETEDKDIKSGLTSVLANRIEYYLVNIVSREKKYIKILLEEIICNRQLSQIIGFLNKNRNQEIEKEVLQVISKILTGNKIYNELSLKKSFIFLAQINSDEIRDEIITEVSKIKNINIETKEKNENEILKQIKTILLKNSADSKIGSQLLSILLKIYLKYQFRTYLQPHILAKINLAQYKAPRAKRSEAVEKNKISFLKKILAVLIVLFPLIYVLRHFLIFGETSLLDLLKIYVLDFNNILVIYSLSINSIYLLLLFFSFLGVKEQANFWNLKKRSFLFKKSILPSISIIAPAYGEQETIIESVNSLLNLEYPDYELIVVNDGSPDNTLNVLIDYFNLEKIDKVVDIKLEAQPIQGIYVNKNISKLIVVDKANGGKADALNVGINVAEKEFFCGIDSDSLLESDALIKLISQSLDSTKESVALGGNIFPINGCKVHKGKLEEREIGRHVLARLQTIEYLRAFMAGRIGWAHIDTLLIISGAFGLFRKDRIIEIGGYLTSSERYKKDTVGEDMELVVRISKHMNEIGEDFAVHYAYNANCWTEVPENFKILRNQRDRWQRGLIDILNFHRPILFNRKYGKMGTIGFPYFFIFETIGPLVEMKGYVMIILAGILGIMNPSLALMLFSASILMGITVSMASLLIAEQETYYFSLKDLAILIGYAFLENFGPRQIGSYWRVKGFFSSLKQPKGWGKMVRKVKSTVLLVVTNNEKEAQLTERFEKIGFIVLSSQDSKTAMEQIKEQNIHLVISQYDLPKSTATDIRKEMLTFESKKNIPFLIFTDKLQKEIPENELQENNMGHFDSAMEDKDFLGLVQAG